MTDQQLHADLERLRAEVNKLARDDSAAREALNALISDIELKLGETAGETDDDGLLDNIRDAIGHFEAEHPRATAILNDIMVTLSNMGI